MVASHVANKVQALWDYAGGRRIRRTSAGDLHGITAFIADGDPLVAGMLQQINQTLYGGAHYPVVVQAELKRSTGALVCARGDAVPKPCFRGQGSAERKQRFLRAVGRLRERRKHNVRVGTMGRSFVVLLQVAPHGYRLGWRLSRGLSAGGARQL